MHTQHARTLAYVASKPQPIRVIVLGLLYLVDALEHLPDAGAAFDAVSLENLRNRRINHTKFHLLIG